MNSMSNPSFRTRMSTVMTTARQATSGVKITSEIARRSVSMMKRVVVSPWAESRTAAKIPPRTAPATTTMSSIRRLVPNTDHQLPFTKRMPR